MVWNRSSEADNAIFINRAQNIEWSFGCVTFSAVLLKPSVANIVLFNFCEQKIRSRNGLSLLIFKENIPIMPLEQNPHQTVTRFGCVGFSMYACRFSATILLVYIPAKIKMSFIWKDDFFLPKSEFSVSRSQDHLAMRSEAYTQPYSFGGRTKLIICQIRHEKTNKKKTLDGGPYTYFKQVFKNGIKWYISKSMRFLEYSIHKFGVSLKVSNCSKGFQSKEERSK